MPTDQYNLQHPCSRLTLVQTIALVNQGMNDDLLARVLVIFLLDSSLILLGPIVYSDEGGVP